MTENQPSRGAPALAEDPPPVPPTPPEPGDCCQSGCIPCVYDLYDDAMEQYREQLRAWRARHGMQA
ncbi:oxidoreductase-like domain-containing protein [Bordetella petrii]|uniref:oxidoreductase-like domain-containing protein n=1 Tax=Bordetella petrii TaxID=94624 RepID=UPI0038B2A47B